MMKRQGFMILALVALAGASGLARQGRVVDDGWCREDRGGGDRQQACEVREFTVSAGASQVAVDATPNGGIQVFGSTRGDIVIRAKVTGQADSQARAREIMAGVRVDAAADKISADGPQGLDRHESWSVSYKLAVPTQTSLQLKSTNGSISIESVEGRIDLTTVNGSVKLSRVGGEVRGRTSNGGVKIRIPEQYSARLEAGTINGGISVDFPLAVQGRIDREIVTNIGAGGPAIRVHTHNGGVKVSRK